MLYSKFRADRLAEKFAEPWCDRRLADLQACYQVAHPNSVLEIGCDKGISTEFWLLHCARVVAVDPWLDEQIYREFLTRCSHYPNVEVIRGYSPEVIPNLNWSFDLCYIDGDHSYEAVCKDIKVCLPLVKPGGWLGGHDYHGDQNDVVAGVAQAVRELLHVPDYTFSDGSWLIRC